MRNCKEPLKCSILWGSFLILATLCSKAESKLNAAKENVTFVSTSEELHNALKNATSGSIIDLAEGEYIGKFESRKDSILIRGKGNRTIIKLDHGGIQGKNSVALMLLGRDCELRNIKIMVDPWLNYTIGIGLGLWRNNVTEIEFYGFTCAVASYGYEHTLSKLVVQDGARGFEIHSSTTSLKDIKLKNMAKRGVSFYTEGNTLDTFVCDGCATGVYITGDYNTVNNAETRNSVKLNASSGILIEGKGNLVEGYMSKEDGLMFGPLARNGVLKNSICRMVNVSGDSNTLLNVDAGDLLTVDGSGHRITKCEAKNLTNFGKNVEIIDSRFKSGILDIGRRSL